MIDLKEMTTSEAEAYRAGYKAAMDQHLIEVADRIVTILMDDIEAQAEDAQTDA